MPRGNGEVKRLMRTVFNLMRATLTAENEQTWTFVLPKIEASINTTVHATTGVAPITLQLGTNPRLRATAQFLGDAPVTDHFVDAEEVLLMVRERLERAAATRAERFNLTRFDAVGDLVAVEDSQVAGGGKLKPKFRDLFVVRTVLRNKRYLLAKKGKRTTVAAHERLRRWPTATE